MNTPDLSTEAKRLLHAIRTVDAVSFQVSGIPDGAMDALTKCLWDLFDELLKLPVSEPSDVAAKFELLADVIRRGEEYPIESVLVDRAVADLVRMRDEDWRRCVGQPHPRYGARRVAA